MKKTILLSLSFALNVLSYSQTQIWGLTSEGGKNGDGVIFRTDGQGDNYTVEYDFDYIDAVNPNYNDLMQATDGMFYGMTPYGGKLNKGVLFKYDPATSFYIKLLDFNDTGGALPQGSLLQASNGNLYGMTTEGGTANGGVLFEYNPANTTYAIKIDFGSSSFINGKTPYGSLIQANDGMLYGMTSCDAINFPGGVIFQYNPVTGIYSEKFVFDNSLNGNTPYGSLLQASDGMLYGMTYQGGVNDRGTLFQYNPITSAFIKKIDFQGATDGANPTASLIQTSDGTLYGMTSKGGSYYEGVVFQYNLTTSVLEKKFDFNTSDGTSPKGSLVQAKDGMLYGMAEENGSSDGVFFCKGVLFQYNPSSSTYTKKVIFGKYNTPYVNPKGSLLLTDDGQLYGMLNGVKGAIFQYDPVNSSYSTELLFTSSLYGHNPHGSLIQASDGMLYGTTYKGGINNEGVLFQYNPSTHVYTKKIDFDRKTIGGKPEGSLIQLTDGMLYGTTSTSETGAEGTIFQYEPLTGTISKKADFTNSMATGRSPKGSLTLANDGMLNNSRPPFFSVDESVQ